jgi:hypothetical protein
MFYWLIRRCVLLSCWTRKLHFVHAISSSACLPKIVCSICKDNLSRTQVLGTGGNAVLVKMIASNSFYEVRLLSYRFFEIYQDMSLPVGQKPMTSKALQSY